MACQQAGEWPQCRLLLKEVVYSNVGASAEDSLEHYCYCVPLNAAIGKICEARSGTTQNNSMERFFAAERGLSEDGKLAHARLLHVKLRLIHFARLHGHNHDWRVLAAIEWNRICHEKPNNFVRETAPQLRTSEYGYLFQ